MDTTKAKQKALYDELVTPANRLKIGKCNLRLSSSLNSKEPTLQVVLDALKLTSFYKAFKITAVVPEIYMQELCVTVSRHHFSLRFKINDKSHIVNVDNFRDMLQICPNLPGMYHNKDVDYVYLLWKDLVFQVEKKNSKKNNDMYYPRFTKVIVDYFRTKDKAIPKRNKMFWHFVRDDSMFTTIRVIFKHQDTQTPIPKYVQKKADSDASPKKQYDQAPKGKRLKATAKVPKSRKKKLPAQGLQALSYIALSKVEQIKIATKRSKIQFQGTGVSPRVLDVPTCDSDKEPISWKLSDDEDVDDCGT
nr:hypothetical protein [Tanacetum cinerariifolium]